MRKSIPIFLLLSIACYAQLNSQFGGTGGAGGSGGADKLQSLPFIISTSNLPDATANSAYSQTLSASNGISPFTWSVLLGTLPTGLTLNSSTGTISGTPTVPGSSTFTILVTDSTSPTAQTATKQFTLSVDCPALQITSTSPLPAGLKGTAYSFQFNSLGGLGTVTWGETGSLPTGVTLSSGGLLSGTPTQSGTFTPSVTATDSCPTPQSITQPFSLLINSPVVITTTSPLPPATQGVSYSTQFSATGGTPAYTWSTASSLPPGLSLLASGVLSGTPTTIGSYTFNITVIDSGGNSTTAQFTVVVSCVPLTITSTSPLPVGTQNVAYSNQLVSSGGTGSVTWSLSSGTSLPSGVTVSSGGLVSGTPTVAGTFLPVFIATDSCSSPQTAQLSDSLTINSTLTISTTSPLPPAVAGTPYSLQLTGSGGTPAYTWSLLSGGLQTGLQLAPSGLISGTPSVATSANFTIQLQDSTGTNVAQPFTLVSTCPVLTLTSTSPLPVATIGIPYSYQFASTGGYAPVSWGVVGGTLPAGLTLSSGGTLSGIPTAAGTFNPIVQVLDSCSPTKQSQQSQFTLTVNNNSGGLTITTVSPLPNAALDLPAAAVLSWGNVGSTLTYDIYRATVSGGPYTSLASSQACCSYTDSTVTINNTYYYVVRSFNGVTESLNSNQVTAVMTLYSTQLMATGGTLPYTWSITIGTLPTGLFLNAASGVISGIPTVAGTSNFTAQVADNASHTATKAFSLTVGCPTLSITSPATLPTGTINSLYSYQMNSNGGAPPFTWSLNSGSFPSGVSINSAGLISGTPTASGSFSPVVKVVDSCTTPTSATQTESLTINPSPANLAISTTSPLPAATQGVAYTTTMSATGGTPPYTWAKTAGSFPTGLSINSAGVISGTPTTIGTQTATIQVTDNASNTASGSFSITVSCVPLSITSPATLPNATQSQAYSFQMASQGGTGTLTWALNSGSFPSGISINSSGLISGTPSASGTFTPNISVTDSCSTPQSTNQTETLTVTSSTTPLSITTTSPLPSGTVGIAYSMTMSATGGTPPYSGWTVTASSLPTGLSLNSSTGVISGTPTVAQTTTPTIRVTDNASNTASSTFSITINPVSAEDNRYCSPSGVWTGPTSDGPAAAPQKCVRTALADMPASGPVTTTAVTSCSSIQSALNAATPGAIIQIPHLNGAVQDTISACQLTITPACSATNWCILETDSPSNLPPEGTRITPGWIGIASLPGRPTYGQPPVAGTYIPKIMTSGSGNNPVIKFAATAAYWLIRGLEITQPTGTNVTQFVQGANNFHNIVLMQDIIHCGNSPTGQSKDSCQDAVLMAGSQSMAIVDSYIYDIHCVSGGVCGQAHGIGVGGNSTIAEGPFKIVNNYIEASGEVIFAGGGGGAAGSTILQASDLEIRRNHTFVPLFWKVNDPTYFGTQFELDNALESKNGQRLFLEGNIFSNTVGYQGSQHGMALVFDPKSQSNGITNTASSDGSGTLTKVSGSNFTNGGLSTLCNPQGGSVGHCRVIYNGTNYTMQTFVSATQITVSPAPPVSAGASTTECLPGLNPNAQVNDVIVRYNYIAGALDVGTIASVPSDCGDSDQGIRRVSWHDTVSDNISSFWGTGSGSCCAWVTGIEAINGGPGVMIPDQILFNHNTVIDFLTSGVSGGAGVGPSLGEGSIGNLLTHTTFTNNIVAGGYGNPAHTVQFYWQNWVPTAQMCYDHNFHMQSSSPLGSGAVNGNFPLPVAADSGGCTFSPTGNTLEANYTTMQFTSLNGGINGNYQLLSSSPGHNAASDGTDVGANIPLVNQNISGVN